ncbi:hypothetical protein BKA64DRAFT_777316 [Cadophora sp. MPI-SDFR-AT-0126]|nr:hypothetical protein BKA64DRAFT_777316 [Leotiomycetes sp. MPI-SDFR-AT-0126]
MGTCLSCHRSTNQHQKELHRIRKSQISPPVHFGPEKSDYLSSSSSSSSSASSSTDGSFEYEPRTPPRPPVSTHQRLRNRDENENENEKGVRRGGRGQGRGEGRMRGEKEREVGRLKIEIQPPTPQKVPNSNPNPNTESKSNPNFRPNSEPEYNFRLATTAEAHQQDNLELSHEIHQISTLISHLIHSIRAYSFLNTQVARLTLADLDAVIKSMPGPPRGLLVRQRLMGVCADVGTLYGVKRGVFGKGCGGVLGEGEGEEDDGDGVGDGDGGENQGGLEGLWESFVKLEDGEKRDMAGRLQGKCSLMRIFALLSALRAGCEELLSLDSKISSRIQQDFESILGELREFDGIGGGGDGERKGFGKGLGGSASMQWRVLGIVEGKRRKELRARMEDVKRGRGRVSAALLSVVEGLAESEV